VTVNKKKLPKAIMPANGGLGVATTAQDDISRRKPLAANEHFNQAANDEPAVRSSDVGSSADSTASVPPAASVPEIISPAEWANAQARAARRRSLANSIVERHTIYSGFGGIIPVPVANIASITAVIVRMVKMLSDHYGVPFERDRARAIVVGLMGGAMPTGLAAATTSALVYIIPISGFIGLAVSSLAAIACTRSIGRVFIEHFEAGATLHDLSAIEKS
jgi:uncharacterized protein (DUF697 family)